MSETTSTSPAAVAAKIDSISARALAITMGTGTGDASALLKESEPLWSEITSAPREMLPIVRERALALAAQLKNAPDEVKAHLDAYETRVAEARFDHVEPPGLIVAFTFLDALERIQVFCESKSRRK